MPLWVLTYHALDEGRGPISTPPGLFADQVAGLAAAGFRFVRLSEGLRRFASGDRDRLVALTFDDGYDSVAAVAAPLLTSLGAAATVFVVRGYLGDSDGWPSRRPRFGAAPLMEWKELAELARGGWEVGAHSETHADLTCLDGPALERELTAGRRIAERLGVEVEALAYPYGRVDGRVRAAAARSGYAFAVTTELRSVPARFDPLAVPRIDAWYLRPPRRAAALGTPRSDVFLTVRRMGRASRSLLETLGRAALGRPWRDSSGAENDAKTARGLRGGA